MNFQEAAKAHRDWNIKLRMYLDGVGDLKADTVCKDNVCPLGQWIYGEGAKFANLPEYAQLKSMHADFHKNASSIVKLIDEGKKDEAKAELAPGSKFLELSSKVVALLGTMEQKAAA